MFHFAFSSVSCSRTETDSSININTNCQDQTGHLYQSIRTERLISRIKTDPSSCINVLPIGSLIVPLMIQNSHIKIVMNHCYVMRDIVKVFGLFNESGLFIEIYVYFFLIDSCLRVLSVLMNSIDCTIGLVV